MHLCAQCFKFFCIEDFILCIKAKNDDGLFPLRKQIFRQTIHRGNAYAAANQQGLVSALGGIVAIA